MDNLNVNDPEQMRVIRRDHCEVGTITVLFTGTREACYSFMRAKRGRNVDLMYSNGRLSSWVL